MTTGTTAFGAIYLVSRGASKLVLVVRVLRGTLGLPVADRPAARVDWLPALPAHAVTDLKGNAQLRAGSHKARAWRGRGIATALTRARLRWAVAHTGTVFYVTGADNAASLRLHAALGFREVKRFASERSAARLDVLSQLVRTTASPDVGPFTGNQ